MASRFIFCLLREERYPRMRPNAVPPRVERKQPETFCWTLSILRSRPAWLLSKRMVRSSRKASTSSRPSQTSSAPRRCSIGGQSVSTNHMCPGRSSIKWRKVTGHGVGADSQASVRVLLGHYIEHELAGGDSSRVPSCGRATD